MAPLNLLWLPILGVFPLWSAITGPKKCLWNTIESSQTQRGPVLLFPTNFQSAVKNIVMQDVLFPQTGCCHFVDRD